MASGEGTSDLATVWIQIPFHKLADFLTEHQAGTDVEGCIIRAGGGRALDVCLSPPLPAVHRKGQGAEALIFSV